MNTNDGQVGTAASARDTARTSASTEGAHPSHTSAALHATAAHLSFRATMRDHNGAALGVLVDAAGAVQHLTLSTEGTWSLSAGVGKQEKRVLLYESAANVVRGGVLSADGTIAYAGDAYVLEPSRDGETWTARLGSRR